MLRSSVKAQSNKQAKVDNDLEWAVELEEDSIVEQLLQSSNDVTPSNNGVNSCFRLAVQHKSLEILSIFFLEESIHPEQYVIDEELEELVEEGIEVKLIVLLQEHASSHMMLLLQRRIAELRKGGRRKLSTPYLVDLIETKTILAIAEKREAHNLRLIRPTLVKNKLETIINSQRWINRTFCDAVDSHFKLIVVTLLESIGEEDTALRPDQTTINEAFISCVKRGYLSMAKMLLLTQPHVPRQSAGADQNSFDQAFAAAMEEGNHTTIDWLLSGTYGFSPSQNAIDDVYTSQALRPNIYAGVARNENRFLVRRAGLRRDQLLLQDTVAQAPTQVDQRIHVRASTEARQLVERQQARQIARRRRNNRIQMMASGSTDIHAFSGTRFADDEVAVVDEVGHIENNANNIDIDADIYAQQHGERVDGLGAGAGVAVGEPGDEAAQGLQALNLFEGGRRARPELLGHSARRNIHDAVVRCIERRVGSQTLTTTQINNVMGDLIETNFPNVAEQARTMRVVSEGMTEENYRILGLVILFLRTFHRSSMSIWIHGFLSEAVAVNSCREGAMERIVTGLRGIEDHELQNIFRQAEGPNLARIFLVGSFNIYHAEGDERAQAMAQSRATQLAAVLVGAGVGGESVEEGGEQVEERVLNVLTVYAEESIRSYGVDVAGFSNDIYQVVQAVCDGYDSFLLPFVRQALETRTYRHF